MQISPFLFSTMILIANLMVIPGISRAQSSIIDRVMKSQESIVAIHAQTIAMDPDAKTGAAITPDGQIMVGNHARAAVAEQSGAGIIIDPSGYIVTNTHTIAYSQFIFATLHNGTRLPAKIAVIAPNSDFTILKIESPSPLKPMPWADSDRVRLGDRIISVGNSPFLKETISGGIIKGMGQNPATGTVELIETDLNLYKGDSGGPILVWCFQHFFTFGYFSHNFID